MGFRYQQETMEKGSSSSGCGLKFGKKIYFEGAGSPPSPAKKGRTGVAAPPRCQVEGCRVDLSDSKAYYCRHKVCGMHSKSPKVIVAGIEQRFCQQCSRFHLLPEFDQGKRSCRRRLAGHNERRRKPPPGPLLQSRYGSLSTSTFDSGGNVGGFVMDFSSYSTSVAERDSWFIPTSGQGIANVAEKYDVSWASTSQNPVPHNLLPSEGCLDSNTGALSLLSNESWSSRNERALSLGVNTFLVQPPGYDPVGQFPFAPWGGFRINQGGDSMAQDMGLAAIPNQTSNAPPFRGELGLAQPSPDEMEASRGHDSQGHHMHWSL